MPIITQIMKRRFFIIDPIIKIIMLLFFFGQNKIQSFIVERRQKLKSKDNVPEP